MVRQIGSEKEMQEVIKLAGNKLLVVHFFDTFGPDFRGKLEEIAKQYDGFVMVEINKYVDPKASDKPNLEKSIEELKVKYLPGYTAGAGTVNPMLVFIHNGKTVRFLMHDLINI